MSRQAALSRVIWSAMVNVVKPGSCLANSTVLMMHLVDNSLNLSQRLTSRETRCSELLLCRLGSGKEQKAESLNKTPLKHWLYRYVRSVFRCELLTIFSSAFFLLKSACWCWYRGVFSQLTEGGECVLMGPADSFNHLLCVCWQDVDLRLPLPLLFLLLLHSVISHHWNTGKDLGRFSSEVKAAVCIDILNQGQGGCSFKVFLSQWKTFPTQWGSNEMKNAWHIPGTAI